MSYFYREVTDKQIQEAISQTLTGIKASQKLQIPYNSFRRLCEERKIEFLRNPGRKGIIRTETPTSKSGIRNRLKRLRGVRCELCLLDTWMGKQIIVEVHHKGNPKDNSDENLQLLCPNCHSQTDSWRRKGFANERKN